MIDRAKTIQLLEQSCLSNESGMWEGTTSEIQDLLNRVRNEALEEAAALCDTANRALNDIQSRGESDLGNLFLRHRASQSENLSHAIRELKQEAQ